MARPREPIALVEAKGKKHLTQEEIEQRKAEEVNAPDDNIKPPSILNRNQKNQFKKLAEELKRIGIISNVDSDLLARYIISRECYELSCKKVSELLAKEDFELGELDIQSRIQDRYFKQCQSAARDLGLTISSRCKLVIPKTNEPEKPTNKFSKFTKEKESEHLEC